MVSEKRNDRRFSLPQISQKLHRNPRRVECRIADVWEKSKFKNIALGLWPITKCHEKTEFSSSFALVSGKLEASPEYVKCETRQQCDASGPFRELFSALNWFIKCRSHTDSNNWYFMHFCICFSFWINKIVFRCQIVSNKYANVTGGFWHKQNKSSKQKR